MKLFPQILASILLVLYPLAMYLGLNYFEPQFLAIFLLLILLARFFSSKKMLGLDSSTPNRIILFLGVLIVIFTVLSNSFTGLKLYPVVVNFSLLLVFLFSLYNPPTIIERFARIQHPDLPASGVNYTRNVTKVWIVFFTINGLLALYTSVFSSIEVWTLYNGLIAYIFIGLLFAGEFCYRKLMLKKN